MFTSTASQIGAATMALVCGFALLRGRWPERAFGVALAVCWIASEAFQDLRLGHHTQPIIFAIDVALWIFLLTLTLRVDRFWLLWATAFQFLIVLTHIMAALDIRIGQWAFFSAYLVWSYGDLAALGLGVMFEARRPVHLTARTEAEAARRPAADPWTG